MNKLSRPLLIGPLLQSFFSGHLCSHKRASIQTIASYRDTFRLLLSYLQQTTGVELTALRITGLGAPSFLPRSAGASGWNARLQAPRLLGVGDG
jgi:hypothetical protein